MRLRRLVGPRTPFSEAADGVARVRLPAVRGDSPLLELDRAGAAAWLSGSEAAVQAWSPILRALDGAGLAEGEQSEVLPIAHADSRDIDHAIKLLRGASGAQATNPAVAPDLRPPKPDLPLAPPNPAPQNAVGLLFQPREGEPSRDEPPPRQPAAPAREQPASQPPARPEEESLIGDVQVEYVPDLGIIILRGQKRDVERVQRIIDDIERQSEQTRPEVQVYALQHANSEALGDLLTSVYDKTYAPRQGPVSITALVKPNALLLIGRAESLQTVQELIRKLDLPVEPATQFEVFSLRHIAATEAERVVTNFFGTTTGTTPAQPQQPGAAATRTSLAARARVVSEARSNTLIVQASPRDLEEVRRIIKRIDVATSPSTNELRIFRLKNSLAQDLATVLQDAITGQLTGQQRTTAGPGQPPTQPTAQPGQSQQSLRSAALELILVDPEKGRKVRSGILSDVRVRADVSGNALIVTGPAQSMDLVGALIEQLDQPPTAESLMKVFTIVNGDATQLTQVLQSLFGQQVTAGQTPTNSAFSQSLLQSSGAGAGESSLVPLRFAVDIRTNSIIASGSSGDLTVVETLLLRLDEGDIETRKMSVVRLKNAPALDVANSIASFLQSQRQLIQQQLLFNQLVSPFEQIEREVVVVPEVVTNSLIVSATPRYHQQIMDVIEKLDFRPAMVMVQVLIAEVQLDDAFEFGVELGLQDSLLFDRGKAALATNANPPGFPAAVPGFNFNNQPHANLNSFGQELLAGQALSSFALGRSNTGLGYGGLVLSAASESVNILLRALRDAGRAQILSRPQIMTLDNQAAFVQVGADVARITGTTVTNGIVQNNVADVQTGLIVRIQPRINQDGQVVMFLDAERSALGSVADGTPIGTDQNGNPIISPPIERTTAQTTISARSGQTVVFAGLITKSKALVSRRVPYVSDIPLLGNLFRFDSETEQRTELLIVMTPYIVQDDADYEWIKQTESERMSWCLADVVEMHGDVGLSGGRGFWGQPSPTRVIYPDVTPSAPANGPTLAPAPVPTPAPDMGAPPGQPRPLPPPRVPPDMSPPQGAAYAPPRGPSPLTQVPARPLPPPPGWHPMPNGGAPNTQVWYGEPARPPR